MEKFSCYLYPEVHPELQSSLRPRLSKGGFDEMVSICNLQGQKLYKRCHFQINLTSKMMVLFSLTRHSLNCLLMKIVRLP